MADTPDSTVARRELGRQLRTLREEAGLTMESAAASLGISLSTLGRIEKAKVGVRPADVREMVMLYERDDLAEPLIALARESKNRSWWHAYGDVIPEWFDVYIGLETAASGFRWYESELVPGILQTAGYARTLVTADHPDHTDDEVNRRVQLRMKRQEILTSTTRSQTWDVVLNEAVIRRPIGGVDVMAEQLNHLLDVANLPNLTLRVVPFAAGMHPGVTSGPFLLLDFPSNGRGVGEPPTVYREGYTGALYTDKPDEVARYAAAFAGTADAALSPAESKTAIATAVKEMTT